MVVASTGQVRKLSRRPQRHPRASHAVPAPRLASVQHPRRQSSPMCQNARSHSVGTTAMTSTAPIAGLSSTACLASTHRQAYFPTPYHRTRHIAITFRAHGNGRLRLSSHSRSGSPTMSGLVIMSCTSTTQETPTSVVVDAPATNGCTPRPRPTCQWRRSPTTARCRPTANPSIRYAFHPRFSTAVAPHTPAIDKLPRDTRCLSIHPTCPTDRTFQPP